VPLLGGGRRAWRVEKRGNLEDGCGVAKKIIYGEHAQEKFDLLRRYGFVVSTQQVRETVQNPEKVEAGYKGRKVAQRSITERHVLRVIYEEGAEGVRIVTFYPGKRSRYES
jgi:hypothetical protein